MTMQVFYAVEATTQHATQTIGYYKHKELAERISRLVSEVYMKETESWLDVLVKTYEGEVVVCPAGTRLKDTPAGRIDMIKESMDLNELQYLGRLSFKAKPVEFGEF